MTPILPLDRTAPDFRARVDTLFEVDIPLMTTEINGVIAQLNGAQASEDAAAASASAAAAAAESASQTAGAVKWLSGSTYAAGFVVWSPLYPGQSYRRIIAGAGTTDPSADPTNWARISVGPAPYLHVREERVSGTNGGTSVTGVNVRTLNTTVGSNTISGASLAGDVVTLPAGTYDFEAGAPAYVGTGSNHRLSMYNHTDSSVIQSGPNVGSITNSGVPTIASCSGRFTLATSKGVKLSHYIASGTATTGLGTATSEASVNEVYAYLILRKVA